MKNKNRTILCDYFLLTMAAAYLSRMRMLAYFSRMRMCRFYAYANSYTFDFISFHTTYAYARMKMWPIRCGHCILDHLNCHFLTILNKYYSIIIKIELLNEKSDSSLVSQIYNKWQVILIVIAYSYLENVLLFLLIY